MCEYFVTMRFCCLSFGHGFVFNFDGLRIVCVLCCYVNLFFEFWTWFYDKLRWINNCMSTLLLCARVVWVLDMVLLNFDGLRIV